MIISEKSLHHKHQSNSNQSINRRQNFVNKNIKRFFTDDFLSEISKQYLIDAKTKLIKPSYNQEKTKQSNFNMDRIVFKMKEINNLMISMQGIRL